MKSNISNSTPQTAATIQKQRNSNLELYRIITMLLIIAHHYVLNSGLMDGPINAANYMSGPSLFLLMFGAFGKTGINCFVLISGYFMCKSRISAKKFAKLFGEVVFYDVLINIIFWVTGYAPFTLKAFVRNILPFTQVAQNFTGCFILFYLSIPFLNMLIQRMTQKQHIYLLVLLGFTYVLMGTVPFFKVDMNYFSWYMVLYFIASYIRLYPAKIFDKTALWGILTLFFVAVSLVSVVACSWVNQKFGRLHPYTFMTDSNTLLAVLMSVSSFLFFKNIKLPYSPFINTVSGTTFGVLLIHAAGESMRNWLWRDVLNNAGMYGSRYMILHAVGSVLGVFIVCSVIDLLRIQFIEKPTLRWWDKHFPRFEERFVKAEKKLCEKFHISTQNTNEQ